MIGLKKRDIKKALKAGAKALIKMMLDFDIPLETEE